MYSITRYDLATKILMTWDQVQFRNDFILYGAHSLNIHDIISRTSNTLFLIRKPTYGSRIKKFRTNFCPPLISTNIDVFTTQHCFCQLMRKDNNFMNSHKLQKGGLCHFDSNAVKWQKNNHTVFQTTASPTLRSHLQSISQKSIFRNSQIFSSVRFEPGTSRPRTRDRRERDQFAWRSNYQKAIMIWCKASFVLTAA